MSERRALVRYRARTDSIDCPFGHVTRVVTAGEGGVANVHVVEVTRGSEHFHEGYDEVYYVLSGAGILVADGDEHRLEPGAVAVIPRGVRHSLCADDGKTLEFVIFGTPPLPITAAEAKPRT